MRPGGRTDDVHGRQDAHRFGTEAVGPGTQLNGIFEIDEHDRLRRHGRGLSRPQHPDRRSGRHQDRAAGIRARQDRCWRCSARKRRSSTTSPTTRSSATTSSPSIRRSAARIWRWSSSTACRSPSVIAAAARCTLEARPSFCGARRLRPARAHEAGVIHRDLSPDNVILPGGNVDKAKIIDFGIARSATVGGGTLLGGEVRRQVQFRLARAARPVRRRGHRAFRHLQPWPGAWRARCAARHST